MSRAVRAVLFTAAAVSVIAFTGAAATPAEAIPDSSGQLDLVQGKGTVLGGLGTFRIAAVSLPGRAAGTASFEWGPSLGRQRGPSESTASKQ
jgi:hypothetical protein